MIVPTRAVAAAIILIAAALRFISLQTAPPGFWYDEGLNGLFVRGILSGDFRMFYGDREPLLFYLQAAAVWLFGGSIFSLRLVPAAAGVLTVAAAYALGRRMVNAAVGLLAAAGMAVSFWHFGINRVAVRVNLLPLFETLMVLALWHALYPRTGERKMRYAVLAGIFGGLTLYTYLASRFFPIAIGLFLLWQLVFDRRTFRQVWRQWLIVAGVSALVFLPLGVHYLQFSSDFFLRSSQVWPYAGLGGLALVSALGVQFSNVLAMFAWIGDENWRHNIAGRPAFDLVAAIALYLGILRALTRPRRAETAMLTIWLLVMLSPSVLAADNPHFLRTFGAIPAAWLLAGIGGLFLAAQVASGGIGRRAVMIGGFVWFAYAGWSASSAYFNYWLQQPETLEAFEAYVPEGTALINRLPAGTSVVASAWIRPHPSVQYLLNPERRIQWFSGEEGLALPAGGDAAVALFGSAPAAEKILQAGKYPMTAGDSMSLDARPLFRLYHVPAGNRPQPSIQAAAAFGELIRLQGYDLEATAGTAGLPEVDGRKRFTVRVYWQVLHPVDRTDVAFSLRLRDPDGGIVFQDDSSPYPSNLWQTGDQIISSFEVQLPNGSPPGVRQLRIVVYERDGGLLQATSAAGQPLGDSALLGPVKFVNPNPPALTGAPLAVFGGQIELLQAQTSRDTCAAAPCPVRIKLLWRATERLGTAYSVFVHLSDPGGHPLAQADSPPGGGLMPTTAWDTGELVEDAHTLRPPPNAPAGLHVLIGLYDPATGTRLTMANGGTVYDAGPLPQ